LHVGNRIIIAIISPPDYVEFDAGNVDGKKEISFVDRVLQTIMNKKVNLQRLNEHEYLHVDNDIAHLLVFFIWLGSERIEGYRL